MVWFPRSLGNQSPGTQALISNQKSRNRVIITTRELFFLSTLGSSFNVGQYWSKEIFCMGEPLLYWWVFSWGQRLDRHPNAVRLPRVKYPAPLHLGSYKKTLFSKQKISTTHHASAWVLVWRDPTGFFISTKFRGSSGHFRFDHFYIVDFHSALTFLASDSVRAEWKSTM